MKKETRGRPKLGVKSQTFRLTDEQYKHLVRQGQQGRGASAYLRHLIEQDMKK